MGVPKFMKLSFKREYGLIFLMKFRLNLLLMILNNYCCFDFSSDFEQIYFKFVIKHKELPNGDLQSKYVDRMKQKQIKGEFKEFSEEFVEEIDRVITTF